METKIVETTYDRGLHYNEFFFFDGKLCRKINCDSYEVVGRMTYLNGMMGRNPYQYVKVTEDFRVQKWVNNQVA